MKLFVSALEYSANVHLCEVLREIVGRGESVELCGIFDEKMVGNSVLGMQFRTCENFGESTDFSLVLSPKFSQIQKPHRNHFDGCFASLANPADCDSLCESTKNNAQGAESSDKIQSKKPNKSFCSVWLSPKVESPLPLNPNLPNNAESQNLGENSAKFAESSAFSINGTSLCDTNSIAVMGFIDVLKKAKFFLDLRKKCLNLALTADKILLMDSSSFNIPLAKRIKKRDKTKQIIYYILPQVWAWKPWRARAIEANCDRLAAILPFEVGFYKNKAKFVGHPLLDEIKAFRVGNSSANSSCGDFLGSASARFLDGLNVLSLSLASHNPKNSSTILEFAPCKFAESRLDSAQSAQNLSEKIKSKKTFKSFCYFWLSPKVESPLPLNHNLPNNAELQNLGENQTKIAESSLDSAISQNLNQNNSVRSTQTRPLRGAKNREQGRSSATADFLLEAESRGSPHKSEKRQLLGTHFKKVGGSGAGGTSLLREESSENNGNENAESTLDSAFFSSNFTLSTQEANSSIFDEKSGLCSCERENRTNGSLTKRATNLPDLSQKDAEFTDIFSFMPGSRMSEIKRIFPIFTEVKDALKSRDKNAKFHLIIPQKFASQNLAQIYGDVSDFHISFDAHRSLFQSRFAFICSGTATLECALIGTPFVLGYKCRALEAFVARCFLNVKFIGLANILYEKISPNETFHTELIQGDLSAQNLLSALDSANENDFLQKSLALRKYLKCGSASAVAKMLYGL